MPAITLDAFPPDSLALIVQWRNDDAVNAFLRPGLRTLPEVEDWYAQYFTRAENQLFAVWCAQTLVGYGTLEHLDATHRNCEIGIVIGESRYLNQGLGTLVVRQLTTVAFTVYHMHRVYAVIQGGNLASMRCFAKAGFQPEGRLREARYVKGTFIDLHYYAVLEHEWHHTTVGVLTRYECLQIKCPYRPRCPTRRINAVLTGEKMG